MCPSGRQVLGRPSQQETHRLPILHRQRAEVVLEGLPMHGHAWTIFGQGHLRRMAVELAEGQGSTFGTDRDDPHVLCCHRRSPSLSATCPSPFRTRYRPVARPSSRFSGTWSTFRTRWPYRRPAMQPNAFEVLGLPIRYTLTHTDIEQAFYARIVSAHPDLSGSGSLIDPAALNEARRILLDDESRARAFLDIRAPGAQAPPLSPDFWPKCSTYASKPRKPSKPAMPQESPAGDLGPTSNADHSRRPLPR